MKRLTGERSQEIVKQLLLAAFIIAIGAKAGAQQLEPRSFTNTPVGMNFLIAAFGCTAGSIVSDPSAPLQNADIQNQEAVLAYARSIDVWGKSGKIDVILPYAWVSGSAEFDGEMNKNSVAGWGDPKLRFAVNFFGAPALSMKEFSEYRQNLILGASLQVTAPLGQYEAGRLYNIGTNRWTLKPELGISKALGPLTLEFTAAAAFYSDNNEFLGNRTSSQDPLYSLQGHVIYGLKSGVWVALDATYYTGGSINVDGMKQSENLDNSRAGLTAAIPVTRNHSLKLFASTGVSERAGGDFDTLGMAWQYRWGGGL